MEIIFQPMFYDIFVMEKRSVSQINIKGFCVVFRKTLDIV